jgi:hypothetical protein
MSAAQNFSVTAASASQCLSVDGGIFDISSFSVTATGYWTSGSSAVPMLRMNNANGKLIITQQMWFVNGCQEDITAGEITVATQFYLANGNWSPTGGTVIFTGSGSSIYWFQSGAPAFFNVTVGDSAGDVCNLQGNVTGPVVCNGAITVKTGATLNAGTQNITAKGNWINDGTFNPGTLAVAFGGTSTISGTGTHTFYDLSVSAASTLTAPATLNIQRNFSNSGTFTHASGTVNFTTSTTGTIAGSTTFNNFSCTTAGKTINFTAASTQTVNGTFTITGTTGNTIKLRSTSAASKWFINDAGTENVTYCDVQDSTATNNITVYPGGVDSGNNTNWVFNADMQVTATAGTAQSVAATYTGPGGNGISIGTFTIANTHASSSFNLLTITLTASGTGNDSNAYSEVRIYEDTNTSTVYDTGDSPYGTAVTAYPADNGSLTFTSTVAFSASTTKRFFVVVKLNGSTLATNGQTFNTQVTNITTSAGGTGGYPSATMLGLVVTTPILTVAATAGTAQSVYANDTGTGGNGISIGTFTLTNNAIGTADLTSITIVASGSGNDSNAFTQVALYEDTNTSSAYDAGDTLYGTAATAYAADNGTLTFTAAATIAASGVKRFFVVVKLNGATPASPGHTFNTAVNSIGTGSGTGSAGTPSTVMNGLTILAPAFTIADNSSATQGSAYLGGSNFVIQQFTVSYPNGPANTLTSITVQASGNGNDQADYSSVALYRDANANATYDAGTDVQVNSFAAFPANDGSQSFTLSGAEAQFTAGQTKQFFIVVAFNMNGTNNTTFATQLQGASGGATGTTYSGLPAPTSGATAGLLLQANNLVVTFNGPGTATTVNNNDQGPGGLGRVIYDVSLQTIAGAWTVTDLTFTGQGTANHQTAYNYLALFEDSNSSGGFDGADTLAVAAAGTTFNGSNQYTATLSNSAFPATTTRRFFLVGKLAGTATTSQTLNAQLTGSTTTPPAGGTVTTIPASTSTALIIDTAVLTANNGTAAPAGATVQGGTAFGHTLGYFTFTSTNNPATLNAVTLTTSGTGTWNTDVSALELYLDDGNGTYDGAPTDTLLFTGAGTTPTMVCTLTSAVNIPTNQARSLWVRLNFAAVAGASTPETFSASIASATDINVTGATALLGTPAPTTNAVSVVIFFVTTFTPAFDVQTGGAAITITGSGFLSPLTVTINGAVCAGTPVISAGGTQITGLTVPPGSGTNRPIVINNGALGAKTLTQTFDYAGGSTVGGGGAGGGGGGGCMTQESETAWLVLLALAGLCGAWALRRRAAK